MSCSDTDGCEVERDLRARLAEVEAERDTFKRAYSRASENGYTHAVARSAAEARLAEVEAELRHTREFGVIASRTARQEAARADAAEAEAREYRSAITWHTTCLSCSKVLDSAYEQTTRAEAAEASLAEVEAELGRAVDAGAGPHVCQYAARLDAVLTVPACRDVGHVETLHAAAGCCDPYETPCAAYVKSMRASAWPRHGEGDR